MPTITPASFTIKNNYVKQFYATGIASPVWTLYGPGSIDQNGIYVAPPTGWGDSVISAHSSTWEYFNTAYFQKNPDDSLTKINNTPGYYSQARSYARLTSVGDKVEVYSHKNNPYWIGLTNGTTDSFVYFSGWQAVGEWHLAGNYTSGTIIINSGDLLTFQMIAGGYLRLSVNGVVKYTSQNTYTTALQFEVDAEAPQDTVYKAPRFSGPGITNYTGAQASVFVQPELLTPAEGCELYCEPHLLSAANGSPVANLPDLSGHGRDLTAANPAPILQTNVLNGKSVLRFNENQPLKNPASFPVRCGWMVVKYDGPYFPVYTGLLTGYQYAAVLVGNIFNTIFYYFLDKFFEVRSNDRIYPASNAPAPMQQYRIIFFRYWNDPVQMDGVQLGTDRDFTSRLWKGDVALLALYSRDFTEAEIRTATKRIADNFNLPLADVYPYQADTTDTTETPAQSVNVYDPPEGTRIVEVLDDPKRLLELKFSVAGQAEVRLMQEFHRTHFPEVSCIYRDYRFTPPEDIEGYLDSPYELDGSKNDFEYSFRFKEK